MQIINKLFRFRKVYIFFISYVLFIITFSTTFLYASTFKVLDIDISGPFELNFNKNKVIGDGFKAAFFNLISMITTSDERKKIKDIKFEKLKSMIDSFTISDEKFINDEYSAKLEVTFNKKKILHMLENRNVFPAIPIRNKVLIIPIIVDLELDNIYLFTNNIFYKQWNYNKKNYHLLEYLLPSEDLDDLNFIQEKFQSIEDYDFLNLVKKYDLEDYIISIIYKNKKELKVLSKIYLKNSFKVDNQTFKNIDLNKKENFLIVLDTLKTVYENYWKKNNEINTSLKLPITVSINSQEYNKIENLEKVLNNLDFVSNFYILKFDNQNMYYKIIYNGSPKTFINDMNKKNFGLNIENDIWKIK